METLNQILLLSAGSQGILLSLALVISSIKKNKATIFLGILLIICSIELLNAWAMSIHYHNTTHAFPFWNFSSYLLLPPSLWFFMKFNSDSNFEFKKYHLSLFIPGIIEITTYFFLFYFRKNTTYNITFTKSIYWYSFTELVPVIATIMVLTYQIFFLFKHFREIEKKQFYKQSFVLSFFSILTILWVADLLFNLPVYSIIEVILCLFLFCLGYVVYFQPNFFEIPMQKNKSGDEQFSKFNDEASLTVIKNLIEKEKLYLQPRLSINDLSETSKLPSRYISYLINKNYKINFTTYINRYRINEVLIKLQNSEESHKTIFGIALDSGFNSKSSFNKVFKDITGKSPTKYLSKVKNSD